ncbi:hypothetical protein FSB78_10530 [Sphingomonas ginsenosidivorax]|uniref:CD-NTase-associated protein 12/Pycsar effector protein TIR domain-containing protein n=1 Tax=Sphingomonas ginsenosidivorax TaxID=862135 RepID=A0A5C6UF34_9SPHN|nr:hypothetical protein [Sphingomonas ginsenosidivorax]TXC71329.1 hypothetical protein FSB78_10530 [Sphingomonas ginsenosidivorax]
MKIFWSWQSDTPQSAGRHFVRDVLAELARDLNGIDGTEDAERPDSEEDEGDPPFADDGSIEVDHDTRGVGGSPPIAETILRKIRDCAVLVADVTPIISTPAGKRVPNPNVMLELGYAVHVLGNERIVLLMNGAQDAALRHLPFDLRHWRAPIVYKLHKDATDEQRREVASELKSALRTRIAPGLRIAEAAQREDDRSRNRAPELSVTIDGEGDAPREVSQTVVSLGVKTLDQIRSDTPILPLPRSRNGILGTATSPRMGQSSILAGLARAKPVSQWTIEETEGYNSFVRHYHSSYERYLELREDYARLLLRSFQVQLKVENTGSLPATAIDVDVTFPAGIILYENDEAPLVPTPPEAPPLRPLAPGTAIVRQLPVEFESPAARMWLPRSTHVHSGERRIHFSTDLLKHHHSAALDPVLLSFVTAADIAPFDATYIITAREPVDAIEGRIHFEIIRRDG